MERPHPLDIAPRTSHALTPAPLASPPSAPPSRPSCLISLEDHNGCHAAPRLVHMRSLSIRAYGRSTGSAMVGAPTPLPRACWGPCLHSWHRHRLSSPALHLITRPMQACTIMLPATLPRPDLARRFPMRDSLCSHFPKGASSSSPNYSYTHPSDSGDMRRFAGNARSIHALRSLSTYNAIPVEPFLLSLVVHDSVFSITIRY